MKSVLFFIECLDLGGAEGILTNIVTHINKERFKIDVVSERDEEFHTEEIKLHSRHRSFIKEKNKRSSIGRLINALIIKFSLVAPPSMVKKVLVKGGSDIEVAFCEGYSTKIIGSRKSNKAKKIAWVHTDLINYPWSESVYGSKEEEKKCYENFDKIVCVSETIKESFIAKYGMEEKVSVIYNIVDSDSIIKKSLEPYSFPDKPGLNFVLVGSFKKVKGYDRFVRICAKLKDHGYNFNVLIMGSGSEFGTIKNMIDELGLNNMISMLEYQDNPYKYIKNADVLICSSYAEGYSTTVTEAIILGKPVITTECSGMREIFGDSECGIICENSEDGLYDSMKYILDNPEKLEYFSENAKKRGSDFSTEKRVAELEDFFCSL